VTLVAGLAPSPYRYKHLFARTAVLSSQTTSKTNKTIPRGGIKMTRKDYEAMAEALRGTYKACEKPTEWKLVETLIVQIANMYSEENERFNKDKFLNVVFS
jgi:hypothetical protein